MTQCAEHGFMRKCDQRFLLQQARGIDLTIFSPRASAMAHHIGGQADSERWTTHCNDLIHRVCQLFPQNFIGVAQLPQSPGVDPKHAIPELRRTVEQLGFVGKSGLVPHGGFLFLLRMPDKTNILRFETSVASPLSRELQKAVAYGKRISLILERVPEAVGKKRWSDEVLSQVLDAALKAD